MQTKLNVGLVLSAIIIPTLTLFAATSTKAQYYDRDPHYYCDGEAFLALWKKLASKKKLLLWN